VVQELSHSQDLYGHIWLTLTVEHVTSQSSVWHVDLLMINCDQCY